MKNLSIFFSTFGGIILSSSFLAKPARAQIVSYCTYISRNDTFNTNGQRLNSISQIIQQDRANLHKFGTGDADDGYERYFTNYNNRVALERAVRNSNIRRDIRNNVLNGNAYICIDYYGDSVSIN